MSAAHQAISLDLESIGKVLGPAGLHQFIEDAIVQPVLQREAGAVKRQEEIGALTNQDAAISPKGLFALEERFDAFAFHDIVQSVGREEIEEGDLIKDLRKRHSSVVVRSKSRRSSIIVPATKYTRIERIAPAGKRLEILRKSLGKVTIVAK